jgi:hypothetical protein
LRRATGASPPPETENNRQSDSFTAAIRHREITVNNTRDIL